MNIYNYHPETQAFISEGAADSDPLEAGNWLIPANATTIAPPAELIGQTRHFVAGAWEYRAIPTPPAPPVPTQAEIDAQNNARILGEIAALEVQQLRPTRELLLNPANAYAANKLATLDAQIAVLRAGLVQGVA